MSDESVPSTHPDPRGLKHESNPSTVPESGQEQAAETTDTRSRFVLDRLHARGGIGEVWRASDGVLGREVALKSLRADRADESTQSRFLLEARITGQLQHPAIVPVYELVCPENEAPFYIMRLVEGQTLAQAARAYHDRLRAGQASPLELRTLLQAFVTVCNAVAYAHARGVLHRDLKGANVLLGGYGEVIVLDWGLAKLLDDDRRPPASADAPALAPVALGLDSNLTEVGQVFGTPAFMAPEQAAGRTDELDWRSDVYGLGAILFEILTGRPPFQPNPGENLNELLARVVRGDVPRPRTLVPQVAPALEAVCLKALARDPADRYPAAAVLGQEVQRWLADEPVDAYPEPWTARLARWGRRHRTAVVGAAALLTTAVVLLGVGLVLLEGERRRTDAARADAESKFRLARQAVDEMLSEVGGVYLQDVPHAEGVRKQLLQRALTFYRGFLDAMPDRPELQYETGRAHFRIGEIHYLMGESAPARLNFESAERLLEPLSPPRPEYTRDLARTHARLGVLAMKANQFDEADDHFQQALRLAEPLADVPPADPDDPWLLPDLHNDVGLLLHARSRWEESAGELRKALQGYDDGPTGADRVVRASQVRLNLGGVLTLLGRGQEAVDLYVAGLEDLAPLRAESPGQPSFRKIEAMLRLNQGETLDLLGQTDEAEKALRQASALFADLAREFPATPEYRAGVANTGYNLAALFGKRNRGTAAEEEFARTLDLTQKLVAEFPQNAEFRELLARTLHQKALFDAQLNRLDSAAAAWEKAAPLLETLVEEQPALVENRYRLSQIYYSQALLLTGKQQLQPAREKLERALALQTRLVEEHPDRPTFRHELARSLVNRGALLWEQKEKPAAEADLRRSLELFRKLVAADPEKADYQTDLAEVLRFLALMRADTPDGLDEADRLADQGLQLMEKLLPTSPFSMTYRQRVFGLHQVRADVRLRRGDHKSAAVSAVRMNEIAPRDPGVNYNAACLLARCSAAAAKDDKLTDENRTKQATQYADLAMSRLQRAVDLGFTDAKHIQADADLATLRERDDYKELLKKLEKK